jgi:hypothetical protein
MLIASSLRLAAQDKKLQEDKDDAFEELMSENITLRFYNAIDGKEIANALIDVKGIGQFTTDGDGKVRFSAPEEDGVYPLTFRAEGFITSEFQFEIMAGALFVRRFSVSPQMDIRFLRVVLDWGSEPRDLDAHFAKEDGYHISYREMRTSADGNGTLDRDDRNGYGPETITVKEISKDAAYRFYVHDYSNRNDPSSTRLSDSRAVVRVFGEGKILKTFSVPLHGKGTRWDVFTIEKGTIVTSNRINSR